MCNFQLRIKNKSGEGILLTGAAVLILKYFVNNKVLFFNSFQNVFKGEPFEEKDLENGKEILLENGIIELKQIEQIGNAGYMLTDIGRNQLQDLCG